MALVYTRLPHLFEVGVSTLFPLFAVPVTQRVSFVKGESESKISTEKHEFTKRVVTSGTLSLAVEVSSGLKISGDVRARRELLLWALRSFPRDQRLFADTSFHTFNTPEISIIRSASGLFLCWISVVLESGMLGSLVTACRLFETIRIFC